LTFAVEREFEDRECDFVEVPLKRERFSLEVKYLSYLQNKKNEILLPW
jgi:hypothetical protein